MKKFPLAAALAVALAVPAASDTLTFSLAQSYAGNLFQTQASGSDKLTTAGLSWEKSLSSFSLFAAVEYTRLWENSGLSDVDLSLGLDYVKSLGEKTALYFALEGDAVRFQSEYGDFNRTGVRFTAALKSFLSPSSILKATAATEYRTYAFAPFDFLSQGLVVSLDKYLPSKTTLKAELGWGIKYFPHPRLLDSSAPTVAAAATVTTEGSNSPAAPADAFAPDDQGPSGKGPGGGAAGGNEQAGSDTAGNKAGDKGPNSPNSPSAPGPGPGQGTTGSAWRGSRSTGYAYYSATGGSQSIQMASFNATVAQGLGTRLGLRLSGIVQRTLAGRNPFTAVEEFAQIENPTYDAFSWQGAGWSAQATAALPWNIELRLGYTWTDKEFPGITALGLDGLSTGITRRDRRNQIEVKVEKTFARWTAVLSAALIRNTSNDPLYDWRGPFVSLGLQWSPSFGKGK